MEFRFTVFLSLLVVSIFNLYFKNYRYQLKGQHYLGVIMIKVSSLGFRGDVYYYF